MCRRLEIEELDKLKKLCSINQKSIYSSPNHAPRSTEMSPIFPDRSTTRGRLLLLLIAIIVQLPPLDIFIRLFVLCQRIPGSLQIVVVGVDCHARVGLLLLLHVLLAATFVVSGNK